MNYQLENQVKIFGIFTLTFVFIANVIFAQESSIGGLNVGLKIGGARLLTEIKKNQDIDNTAFLRAQMKKIGNSTTDLYTGSMEIKEICAYCISKLKKMHRYRKDTYLKWLHNQAENYQLIDLPDGSVWILKIGIEEGRHIHIHPGRLFS